MGCFKPIYEPPGFLVLLVIHKIFEKKASPEGRGGVLPYTGYLGMCCDIEYGFSGS